MKQMSYSFQKNIFFVFFLFAAILPEQDTSGKQASILKTYLIKHRHEAIFEETFSYTNNSDATQM